MVTAPTSATSSSKSNNKHSPASAARNRNRETEQYRIVGAAELDADRGWVSAVSPIGRALVNAQLGQRVRFRFPSGEDELEITHITYE